MSCNELLELVNLCFGFTRPGSNIGAGSGRSGAPAFVSVRGVDTLATPKPVTIRAGTKQPQIIALLQRPEGAAVAEIVAETGWLAHSVRGMSSGALKKKLGLPITSRKEAGRGTVYTLEV